MWKWRCVHENYTDTLAINTVWWWSVVVVVVLCGSGGYIGIYRTLFAHVVVSSIGTCAGGVFPSSQWCRYQAYAQATCTVWWCILGGGGRCIRVCGGGGCCYGVMVLGKCAGVSQRKY